MKKTYGVYVEESVMDIFKQIAAIKKIPVSSLLAVAIANLVSVEGTEEMKEILKKKRQERLRLMEDEVNSIFPPDAF